VRALYVILLHDPMVDKQQKIVTTAVTPIDLHDISRSCATYGVRQVFIAHPAIEMRKLIRNLLVHWESGFGAQYNPNRQEALSNIQLVSDLDEAIAKIDLELGVLPTLVATSAKDGGDRITFSHFRASYEGEEKPYLLMLGTGWGMANELLDRADLFLEPIKGPTPYNHLSVRSACAIMLDRIFGLR
jgi:hypothetical protein